MRPEEMTSRERVLVAVRNQKPDRVPVVPMYLGGAIKRAGYKYSECLFDADKYVSAAVKCYNELGFDGIYDFGLPQLIAEAVGARLRIFDDDPPVSGEPLLKEYADIDKLEQRDVRFGGHIPHVLSIISKMRRALGPDVAIVAIGTVPFRIADCFRGTQSLYKDMIRNPEFVKTLLEFGVQPCIDYGQAAIEAGADVLMIPDALSGKTAISRKHYSEFNLPFAKKLFSALSQRGIAFCFHTCGDWSDRFDLATDGPTGLLLAGEADLGEIKTTYGSKVSLAGNVKSVDTMLLGTPQDVEREGRECIEKGAHGGGFVLSADCVVPPATPEENLHALVQTARRFGGY